MNNKNKKKKPGAAVWTVVAALIIIFNMLDDVDEWQLRRFFLQLKHTPVVWIAILAVAISVAIALVALAANKRRTDADPVRRAAPARSGGNAAQHSHDRIQGYAISESEYEHWKKQLDGFLAAGIIDRREYQALLERRRDSF